MAELNWTREAETWLEDIYNYIAADNPQAAAQTVNGIYQKAQLLKRILKSVTGIKPKAFVRFASFSTAITELPI